MIVRRMPLYTINTDVIDKEQIALSENMQDKLESFLLNELTSRHNTAIKVGYNTFEIRILNKGLGTWNEEVHNNFCQEFQVILYSVETEEMLTAHEQDFTVIYTYIPKFIKEKYNEEYALDFNYVLALMP